MLLLCTVSIILLNLLIPNNNNCANGFANKMKEAAQSIGQKGIEQGFKFYCEHSGKGVEKFVSFVKCDEKHAEEKYCQYAESADSMYHMLCEVMKDKGVEWFGKAMDCTRQNNIDCFTTWFNEMQSAAEMMKTAGR